MYNYLKFIVSELTFVKISEILVFHEVLICNNINELI